MPGWRGIPGQRPQLLLPLSSGWLLFFQIFLKVSGYCRCFGHVFWNTVKKLANAGMSASLDFFFRSDSEERTLVQHGNAIRDAKCARHLVCDYNDCHLERSLQKQ